ncbi:MAG: phosphoenolpyruvate synthase [Gammaproteobacteria bacterium]|nr:phosphoenolpyruvate synthase [Gammaproteobacteria bacterium]NNC98400.1 phosphoenolpyruvate synthase [Gammaproteobacteria bacterium]NNM13068.1 phosphoenolpyruvate synthase [Gammaproteobacteria bacterium]
MQDFIIRLNDLGMQDIDQVGGKNASLGELISNLSESGVNVPGGFATTAHAYREFLEQDGLAEKIRQEMHGLDVDNIQQLTRTGKNIRNWILEAPFSSAFEQAIRVAFTSMTDEIGNDLAVAVRSSATAEDLPDASFAGQQETFLNVRGIENVLTAIKEVFASLYNDRAIAYRVHHGFEHHNVALSAGIQQMVRSDTGASGVMFTLDTESGFRDVIFITASYGLGETVVQGAVNPDEFYVGKHSLRENKHAILRRTLGSKAIKMVYAEHNSHSKAVKTVENSQEDRQQFCLSDDDVETLARQALAIESHYQRPMDIEWGKDGITGKIYILQARPETVQSRSGNTLERYQLEQHSEILLTGRAIGQRIGAGKVRVIKNVSEMDSMQTGDVLVADMTDPDWEPVMKRASAIVTNRGGRTCHAAIIARELGIPAVVGCGNATQILQDRQSVTVSCAEGDTGNIYAGDLEFVRNEIALDTLPEVPVKIMMNVGNPDRAFDFASLPHRGVGLARLEFIINRMIGIHPKALLEFEQQSASLQKNISQLIAGYKDPVNFYIDKLSEGIATIAAAFYPQPVIVRMSDFKSNEYANLVGGENYEPHEENPMLGFRGASRYISDDFRECFALECAAIRKVRNDMGLDNVQVMIPFVRTVAEAAQVVELLKTEDLERGKHGLKLIMMCELPSNALLADEFLEHFDGMSIGSNDMTQLTLGLDRDSGVIAHLFDERDAAVKKMLSMAITACKQQKKYIGICGQGPSDHPDLAEWLLDQGIESMSLNPDTVVETWLLLAGQKV